MSLPPGFLDELRTRTSLSGVVGRKVMWDTRKSNPGKGDMWAPCPFHQEKSASFHVDDRKGYYYCFGCQAKGDAISFVRETENVGFMEAIQILAGEAGMEVPRSDPKAQEKADERTELAAVMEQAVQFFRLQLSTGAAAGARDYLQRRGLGVQALEQFEIGYAPNGWQGLFDHLTGKGVPAEQILAAGLAKASSKGKAPYDTFRHRIMFPIRDGRGRAIAFGGRAMDPEDKAKYLNSPETLLFDKGRSLYHHGPARAATGRGAPLIVAEGYMDVIALVTGGFEGAVAPLGTAITESQLQMMWRITDEPIIALDGDKAGLRAAQRLIDLALPLLEAGKSLRFALMPEGQDPDDLIRSKGAAAVQKVLDSALPMVQLLWDREIEGRDFDSPERKAALDKVLRDKIKLIKDPSIRGHYGQAIKDMRWQLFSNRRATGGSGFVKMGRQGTWRKDAPLPPMQSTKSSVLAAGDSETRREIREAVILAALIQCPEFIVEFEAKLEAMRIEKRDHAAIRDVILANSELDSGALREKIISALGLDALENLTAPRHVAITPCLRRPGDLDLTQMTIAEELAKLDAERGLSAEIAEAEEDLSGVADETVTWRLGQAAEAMSRAQRSSQEDRSQYDVGPNGARINRDERSALDALLKQITGTKNP
jgi:DNA primase